jgi:hypothetical protein
VAAVNVKEVGNRVVYENETLNLSIRRLAALALRRFCTSISRTKGVVIDGTPEQVFPSLDRHDGLVEVPFVPEPAA